MRRNLCTYLTEDFSKDDLDFDYALMQYYMAQEKIKPKRRAARMRLFFNKRTFRKDFLAENKVMDKKVAFACRIRNDMRKSKRTL